MKIIIVGCGKVGTTLATQLSKENNDICVVDTSRERVQWVISRNDIMGVCGDATSYEVLQEAGIETANLLIAVTHSDELNLMCCVLAQKNSKCEMIARVRNPIYHQEGDYLKKRLGLTRLINPELMAAAEIFQILCFPSALEVDFFSMGKAQMVRARISEGSALDGMSLREVSAKINDKVLICVLERGSEIIIPKGDTVLKSGDMVSILAVRRTIIDFFRKVKGSTKQVKSAMIIGGGTIAEYLMQMLMRTGIKVKVIDNDLKRCEELNRLYPEATIIHGDGSDKDVLVEERINQMDAFVALTGFDEENILLSLFARREVRKKVVTKINRFQLNEVVHGLDLDSVVYPKGITTERILEYVRATSNTVGSNISTLYRYYDDRVEALEFKIKEESVLTNTPLHQLNLKKNNLIGCIMRNGKTIIPKGDDRILVGDSIVVVTTTLGLQDAQDIVER